jgi:tetratricopeptide (TPR) repeat protein
MFSISDPKLKSIGKDIIEGRGIKAIGTLDEILKSKNLPVSELIDYQLLRIQVLIELGDFRELETFFKLIWNNILEQGTDLQQLDLLLMKTRFLISSTYTTHKELDLFYEIEKLIKKFDDNQSVDFLQRYVLFLIYKRVLTQLIKEYDSQREEFAKEALSLSEEINYEYGIVLSILHLIEDFDRNHWEEHFDLLERASNICEKNKYVLLLGRVYTQISNLYWVKLDLEARLEFLNKAQQIFKKINAKKYLAENHNNLVFYYHHFSDYDKVLRHLEISYDIAHEIGFKFHEVKILHNYGSIYLMKMEYSKATPYFEKCLEFAQEIESERFSHLSLRGLGIAYTHLGELNKAIKVLSVALESSIERDHKNDIASLQTCLMIAYLGKGELKKALEYSNSIDYFEEAQNYWLLSETLRYRGEIFQMMGDSNEALNNFKRSLEISKLIENEIRIAEVYFSLVVFYLEKKDLETSIRYAKILEDVSKETGEKLVNSRSLLAQALILKEIDNPKDKSESIRILEEVIKIEDLIFNLLVTASLNLCELLLLQLKESEDQTLLRKLFDLTEELHVKAIQHNVYSVIAQTVWLQSQIALLDLDVTKARILMSKAQSIAEEREFEKLAIKISNVHDILLEQLDIWENMLMELPAIAERLELTHIETILEEMIRGKGIVLEESEREVEEPILLFITSDTGSILYSEQFDTNLDDQIISQILPSILDKNKKIVESHAIDRSMYQEYNYLIKKLENVSFCYMFIGKSYEGLKKLTKFTKIVFESSQVWNELTSTTNDSTSESSFRILLNQFVDSIFV